MATRIERERAEGEAATVGLQYPRYCSREGGCEDGRPAAGPLLTAEQEGRDFLLNSYLIRSIHLLSLYREIYLTPKQGLLDP